MSCIKQPRMSKTENVHNIFYVGIKSTVRKSVTHHFVDDSISSRNQMVNKNGGS